MQARYCCPVSVSVEFDEFCRNGSSWFCRSTLQCLWKIPVYPRQGYLPLHFWSKLWTCKILPWHVECRSQRVVNLVRSRSTLSVTNCRPSLVELSWQYLRRSTFDWRPWPTMPVCHTERPPLCTARRAWLRRGSASRGSIIGSRWYV